MSTAILDSHETGLDLAVDRFKAEREQLSRDGRPIYTPEEHERRLTALRRPLEAETEGTGAVIVVVEQWRAAAGPAQAERARLDARLKAAQLLEGRDDRAGWELRDGLGGMMRGGVGQATGRG